MSLLRCIARQPTPAGCFRIFYLSTRHALQLSLTDPQRPGRVQWRRWQSLPRQQEVPARAQVALKDEQLLLHWHWRGQARVLALPLPSPLPAAAPGAPTATPAQLKRSDLNPILAPQPARDWESLAVFNAAAIELEGRVHFVYRAVGDSGQSVFGHAVSNDGVHMDERSAEPVFVDPGSSINSVNPIKPIDPEESPAAGAMTSCYSSGPSSGGCEDPRLTRIGDRLYMTYTAYDGRHPPSVAFTHIAVQDFLARRWTAWTQPQRISAPMEAHKNWMLFPDRIGGKYALLHGISPGIMVEYRDTLDFEDGRFVDSHYACSGRDDAWDNRLRGAGPPPIRTEAGWLLLYHAMDRRDPGRYKLGAMLLDLHDPCHILARLPHPLLEPDAPYENDGLKSGVVYACGAALLGDALHVYYGGADTVICVATVSLRELLTQLGAPRPTPPFQPRSSHAAATTRPGQPIALAQPSVPLGTSGRLQPRGGEGRRRLSLGLPRTIRAS